MGAACGRSSVVDDPRSRYDDPLCVPITPLGTDPELEAIVNGLEVSSVESSAECPVCLEYLCEDGPLCVLMRPARGSTRRACSHLLHERCAHSLQHSASAGSCPCCRAEYTSIKRVPQPTEDPHGWFKCVDAEEDGLLSQQQVADALAAAFPINCDKFEAVLPQLWERWDLNGSGFINKQEFMARGALFEFAHTLHLMCIEAAMRTPSSMPVTAPEAAPDVAPDVAV